MRRETPEHKRRAAKQRYEVRKRDRVNGKQVCLLERLSLDGWKRCGRVADQTVHVIRRKQCGEHWDAPEVAILGCEDCHHVYDHRFLGEAPFKVRVPYDYAVMAWEFLMMKVQQGEIIVKPTARYSPYDNPDYEDVRGAA
jgi:hypothetical protein